MTHSLHQKALDFADCGDWQAAHELVQGLKDPIACWIHANLHREEGDHSNAAYWYQAAGQPVASDTTAEERKRIRAGLQS